MPISTIGQNGLQQSRILTAVQQPAGAVLQVVQSVSTATTTTTSTSPQQSGLTVTITPISATSKMLLMLNGGNTFNDALGAEVWYLFGRNIGGGGYTVLNSNQQYGVNRQANGSSNGKAQTSNCYLDSPATTSSIVYQPYFQVNTGGSGTAYFNQGTIAMTFTVMEIAA
jgi:hypothetical protein